MTGTVYEYYYYDYDNRVCEKGMLRLAATVEQVMAVVIDLVFPTHPHIQMAEILWVVDGKEEFTAIYRDPA